MGEITAGIGTYGVTNIHRRGSMNSITIGKYCAIAEGVVMDSGFSHNTSFISTYPFSVQMGAGGVAPNTCRGDIVIGNDVWICEGAMIMSGVTIGDGAIISARAVVTKDVRPYHVVGGVPAKVIKTRFYIDDILNLQKISWWNWCEEKIKANAELLNSKDIKHFIEKHYEV